MSPMSHLNCAVIYVLCDPCGDFLDPGASTSPQPRNSAQIPHNSFRQSSASGHDNPLHFDSPRLIYERRIGCRGLQSLSQGMPWWLSRPCQVLDPLATAHTHALNPSSTLPPTHYDDGWQDAETA